MLQQIYVFLPSCLMCHMDGYYFACSFLSMDTLQQPRRSERLRLLRIAVNSSGREELHVGDSSTMTRSMQSGVPSTSTVGVSAECPAYLLWRVC